MTVYDAAMIVLGSGGIVGAMWASHQIAKAAKEGKLRAIGVVTRDIRMDDSDRMDWLAANGEKLKDVYWRMQNKGETVRQAVDNLADKKHD